MPLESGVVGPFRAVRISCAGCPAPSSVSIFLEVHGTAAETAAVTEAKEAAALSPSDALGIKAGSALSEATEAFSADLLLPLDAPEALGEFKSTTTGSSEIFATDTFASSRPVDIWDSVETVPPFDEAFCRLVIGRLFVVFGVLKGVRVTTSELI